ncbi:hypothetical protein [Bradyrhizobium sp. CCBAU 53421]|uniref:hypothetical protein n=1 Tax=Bradyrhizobium sp. CCBAU 53421 TaxID=1325120 RepID=UPI00188AE506|nr:hypothetical protein [Bradyrhizobium sp. CCBAU 53421]
MASTASPEQRIELASEAIRQMAEHAVFEPLPRQDRWLHHLSEATKAAPLQSLTIAFLLGVFLAHR